MKKIYYIECTTSETRSAIKGYFETLEDAKHVGGIVTEYTNKYSNYYETNIC